MPDPTIENPLSYDPATDTLLVTLRPWPADARDTAEAGGEDAGPDLVIHDAPDGAPWAWEIEHASAHPDLVGRALAALRAVQRTA